MGVVVLQDGAHPRRQIVAQHWLLIHLQEEPREAGDGPQRSLGEVVVTVDVLRGEGAPDLPDPGIQVLQSQDVRQTIP